MFLEPLFHNRELHYHGYDREENWRKDEILAAKIKKFLTVSRQRLRKPELPEANCRH
jgi:hypothetical protein